MRMLSTQRLVSKYNMLLKKQGFLEEIDDFRSGTGNIQDEPGAPSSAKKEVLKKKNKQTNPKQQKPTLMRVCQRDTGPTKRALNVQSWNI